MKHLITTDSGGFPFDLDDYRFMESGFNEDIVSILKAYKYTPQDPFYGTPPPYSFIIYGCEIIPVSYTPPGGPSEAGYGWTEGAVLINGIIYKVNARNTPSGMEFFDTNTHGFYFNTSVTYDPNGYENFRNGTPHNTYGIRMATPVLSTIAAGAGKLLFERKTPRFLSRIKHVTPDYVTINAHGGAFPDYSANWQAGTPALGSRKNEIGQVEFRGLAKCLGIANAPICILPVDHHPNQLSYFVVPNITANTAAVIGVSVVTYPGGNFSYLFLKDYTAITAGDVLDFSGLRYPAAQP